MAKNFGPLGIGKDPDPIEKLPLVDRVISLAPAPAPANSDDTPSRLTIAELMGLKVLFKCRAEGAFDETVEAPLLRLVAESKVLADTIAACGDSVTAAGMPVQVPGVPGAAVRNVVAVLLKGTLCKLWLTVDKYEPKWNVSKKKTDDDGGGNPTYHRSPSGFEWVNRNTYKFLHMFEFDALRGVVDEFCAKFPTLETIRARDAVSPTDASWASERELATLAELVFYNNPSIAQSKHRDLVEEYLGELSAVLLARALGHLGFKAMYRFPNQDRESVPNCRHFDAYSGGARLHIQRDHAEHLICGGPIHCHQQRGSGMGLSLLPESEEVDEMDVYGL